MKTKLFTFIFAIVASMNLWAADSGSCGDNLTWTLDDNGTLTISGTGSMTNYNSSDSSPWYNNSNVKKVIINSGVTSIGSKAFYGCSGLTSITIPNSVTSIGEYAFEYCSSLTSITIPNSVTSIGNDAFSYCKITSINYLGSLEDWLNIKWGPSQTSSNYTLLFNGVEQTSITIPNSVTSIGEYAFNGCSSLTSITIPNSVTSIGNWAFYGCNITSINYLGSLEDWLNKKWRPRQISSNYTLLFNGVEQTSITTPNNVTNIGEYAFSNCSSLTSVIIPNSVTSIGEWAFYGCIGLKNVILGSLLKVIESSAFSGCSSIETITCYSQRPPTVKDKALNGLNYSTIVYVPADYLDTYKMHDAWGLYDVRPIGAKSTQTDNVQVTPQENTADIVWPAVSGASTYELVIKDKQGNIICTLIFNAKGQLTQLVFHAPAANGKQMPEQTQTAGFSFTITGLNQGTTYNYTITSKDDDGNALDTKSGTFTTNGATGLEDVIDTQHFTQPTKVMIDGAVYILMPDGRMFNLQGAEVR